MRVKPTDLNLVLPPMRKATIIAEANMALEALERIEDQIRHWMSMPIQNEQTKLMIDELLFLRNGKI